MQPKTVDFFKKQFVLISFQDQFILKKYTHTQYNDNFIIDKHLLTV